MLLYTIGDILPINIGDIIKPLDRAAVEAYNNSCEDILERACYILDRWNAACKLAKKSGVPGYVEKVYCSDDIKGRAIITVGYQHCGSCGYEENSIGVPWSAFWSDKDCEETINEQVKQGRK